MNTNEDIADRIEAYINHRLSPEETKAFEAKMQQDPTLLEAVELERSLSLLMLEKELLDIKAKIRTDIAQAETKRLNTYKTGGAIAGLVILSTASFLYLHRPKWENAELKSIAPDSAQKIIALPQKMEQEEPVLKKNPTFSEPSRVATSAQGVPQAPDSSQVREVDEQQKPIVSTQGNSSLEPIDASQKSTLENQKNETKNGEKTVDPCAIKPEVTLFSTPTRKGENTGKLSIKLSPTPTNSTLMYSIQNATHFGKESHFDNLSLGKYTVYGKDGQGCVYLLGEKSVAETWCVENYQKTFSPDHDPTWTVPIQQGEEAHVKITDKTGSILFDSRGFTTQDISWSGNLSSGAPVPTGVYKVFISYTNGETCVASVTVFR